MSVRKIALGCDTPGCQQRCQFDAPDVETAARLAAEQLCWSQRDGEDFCGFCTRKPACCRCVPTICKLDDSGEHCATAGCAYCLEGCPATDRPCCKESTNG